MKHEIVVENVGTVITTEDEAVAEKAYTNYVTLSRDGVGRCSGESVTWMRDDDVYREFDPRCPHGKFYSGAGACPECGRGAE